MSLPICNYRSRVPLSPRQASALGHTAGKRPPVPPSLRPAQTNRHRQASEKRVEPVLGRLRRRDACEWGTPGLCRASAIGFAERGCRNQLRCHGYRSRVPSRPRLLPSNRLRRSLRVTRIKLIRLICIFSLTMRNGFP